MAPTTTTAHVLVKTVDLAATRAAHARSRDLTYATPPPVVDTVATASRGMVKTMNSKVIITCALTGAGDTVGSPSTCP